MKLYAIDENGFKSELKDSTLGGLLGCEPNDNMSRYMFFKLLIQYKLNRGNAYVYITRDNRFNPISLELIQPEYVLPIMLGGQLKYHLLNMDMTVDNSDIIHIMNYPVTNGLNITQGVSTIEYAANTLQVSTYAERTAKEFFRSGANTAGAVTSVAPLNDKQKQAIIDSLKTTTSIDSVNPNGIAILAGSDFKFVPFGITPKDSQLIESRQWNITDIGRFFNVNPILLFDVQQPKGSTAENAQLDFLNTTLLPEIELIENEFTRKLILPSQRSRTEIRFNLSNLLRADSVSRADYFQKLSQIGVMSPNDIAKDLNLPQIKGGDVHTIPVNVMDIENIIYNNPANVIPVDNKMKMNTPKSVDNSAVIDNPNAI
jgi:HK97 family phage portal protein